jgi:nucleotide-binding universal stress UspA family protein
MTKYKAVQVRRILVAVDGSNQSVRAVKMASQMTKGLGAELTLIHVMNLREIPTLIAEAENGDVEEYGQMILGKAAKVAMLYGIEPKAILRKGHIADQILRFADNYKPDIIIMGSRGYAKLKGSLLGSVSQSVSSYAKCSVLIVR